MNSREHIMGSPGDVFLQFIKDDPLEQQRYALLQATHAIQDVLREARLRRMRHPDGLMTQPPPAAQPFKSSVIIYVRKPGEPDWGEVKRDAIQAVAHKLFGEEPGI